MFVSYTITKYLNAQVLKNNFETKGVKYTNNSKISHLSSSDTNMINAHFRVGAVCVAAHVCQPNRENNKPRCAILRNDFFNSTNGKYLVRFLLISLHTKTVIDVLCKNMYVPSKILAR